MKKTALKLILVVLSLSVAASLFGCASFKKKFMRKIKKEDDTPIYYQGKKYAAKPSMELYQKHYVYWINWHKELIEKLGKNVKSNIRSTEEMMSNLQDMSTLLVDEKSAQIAPHIDELEKVKSIIVKRNMTKSNETRIRQILQREYRTIKREFSPTKMTGFIREEFKED